MVARFETAKDTWTRTEVILRKTKNEGRGKNEIKRGRWKMRRYRYARTTRIVSIWSVLKNTSGLTARFALEERNIGPYAGLTAALMGLLCWLMEGRGEEPCVSLYAHHGPPWRGRKDARSILGRRLKGKGRYRLYIHPCVGLSCAVRMPEHFERIS